jgi:hypothetical protein
MCQLDLAKSILEHENIMKNLKDWAISEKSKNNKEIILFLL